MGVAWSPPRGMECCMPEPVRGGEHCCQSCTQEGEHVSRSSAFARVETISMLEFGPGSAPIGAVLDETMGHLGALDRQLLLFCGTTCLAAVHWLIYVGANWDTADANGSTCLHVACRTGAVSIITELLEHSDLIEAIDIAGWTPLHVAAHVGRKEAVLRLLEAGASPDARTRLGQTPLQLSMDQGTRRLLSDPPLQRRPNTPSGAGGEPADDGTSSNLGQASRVDGIIDDTAGLPTEGDPEFYFVPPKRAIWDTLTCETQLWHLAVMIFNQQPGYGLAFVVACGLADSYSEAAKLILKTGRASRRRAGMFLGTTFSVCKIIRFSIFDSMDLAGTGVVGALGLAFALLQLPGDLRMAARLVQAVAEVWWVKHRRVSRLLIQRGEAHHRTEASEARADRIGEYVGMDLFEYLASWDALAQLMLSTILLHWYVHGDERASRRKMPVETWLALNRGIENGGANIPEHVQRRIYKRVCRDRHSSLSLAAPERGSSAAATTDSDHAPTGSGNECAGAGGDSGAGAPLGATCASAASTSAIGADAAGGAKAGVAEVAEEIPEEPSGPRRGVSEAPSGRRGLSEADSAAGGLGKAEPQDPSQPLLSRCAVLECWVQVLRNCLPFSSHDLASLPESAAVAEDGPSEGGTSPRAEAASALGGGGRNTFQAPFLAPLRLDTAPPVAGAPGALAEGHVWASICSMLLLFSAHPHACPHALTDARRLCPSAATSDSPVLTFTGMHTSDGAEEEATASEVEPPPPILVLLLLPDGRWREVHVPRLELRFQSAEEAGAMGKLLLPCPSVGPSIT